MSEPFLGEIRLFPYNFAPRGWAFCEGQTLSIAQNSALFSLLGTTYGGNGTSTFQLPDLRGRVPIHMGGGFVLGTSAGQEGATLTVGQIPAHNHTLNAAPGAATLQSAAGHVLAAPAARSATPIYGTATPTVAMKAAAVALVGSGLPASNLQPILALSPCIAMQGIFPARN